MIVDQQMRELVRHGTMSMKDKLAGKLVQLSSAILAMRIWPWAIRSQLLRVLGVNIAPSSRIGHGFEIVHHLSNLTIHSNVFINAHAYIQTSAPVTIHEYVRIGPYFRLLTTLHPYEKSVIRRSWGGDVYMPTSIGRGCALGIGVTVLPGVSIAEGCVVAAGAVVTESTLANGLYAGVPARRVRDLKVEESSPVI